jgi:mannose/fructose/N-acetylgalactosamine-specific phosphotransferase system component IIB
MGRSPSSGSRVPVELYRIDDRLIHGQVVVGWGQPLDVGYIVLVDDAVAQSEWEQELYRMGVPPTMDVFFDSEADFPSHYARYASDRRPGIVVTGTVATMLHLAEALPAITAVNVGGLHHQPGRRQRLRYVFLTETEADELARLGARGVAVTAQDLPGCRPVPLGEILNGRHGR